MVKWVGLVCAILFALFQLPLDTPPTSKYVYLSPSFFLLKLFVQTTIHDLIAPILVIVHQNPLDQLMTQHVFIQSKFAPKSLLPREKALSIFHKLAFLQLLVLFAKACTNFTICASQGFSWLEN
jgi:hypothetical protein